MSPYHHVLQLPLCQQCHVMGRILHHDARCLPPHPRLDVCQPPQNEKPSAVGLSQFFAKTMGGQIILEAEDMLHCRDDPLLETEGSTQQLRVQHGCLIGIWCQKGHLLRMRILLGPWLNWENSIICDYAVYVIWWVGSILCEDSFALKCRLESL